MKVGDLVKWRIMVGRTRPEGVGIVTRAFDHKLWRTQEHGKMVDFAAISTEPFVEVVFNNRSRSLPVSDLEVISENA
jgi:hypothetical protein